MAVKKVKKKTPAKVQATAAAPAERTDCPVVGIGASAGGLEAFTELLHHMPSDPGFAIVLVQHLDPKHASILSDLLSRSTKLPVSQAEEGLAVQPNHVYVIPPNSDISLSAGALHLKARESARHHLPIDYFFTSLARDQGGKAIGVILSGTASDGTLGLKAIKAEGGITFAQDVHSAKYDGMPRSAIAAGCVDFVLSPDQIARELLSICRHPYLQRPVETPVDGGTEDEVAFREVFAMLRNATGVDFSSYKPGTIRRRTQRRMALLKVEHVHEYARYLKGNRDELHLLFQDLLINVTGFFREPGAFEGLTDRVFPSLLMDHSPDEALRVWVPGCATGEEVYSIAISLIEFIQKAAPETRLQIFGTDLSEPALEKARTGLYPESIANDVSEDRLRRFFIRVNSSYQITRAVRDCCVFARQNVTKDPPFSKLDLVLCRNVLIYLGPSLQAKVMRLFHYALKPNGFLVLGHSESIGASTDLFSPYDKKLKIYARKDAVSAIPTGFDVDEERHRKGRQVAAERSPDPDRSDLQRRVDQVLLSRHSPPAIVVDRSLRISHFLGQASTFLEHVPGEAHLNLLKMRPVGLGLEVRKLVRAAEIKNAAVKVKTVRITTENRSHTLDITVTPFPGAGQETLFLVALEESVPPPPAELIAKGKSTPLARRNRELEHELLAAREYLQAVIEEQEAASEELKSAHEEVQSGNEELQSTNEELLTAKEELQSTNEELTTVNEEMQSRNSELHQLNNDLLNLLSSVNIPIVMLGSDLRIRRFTPQAEKILNLLATDIGRPISDFRLKVNIPDLAGLCQAVIDDLHAREREVQDSQGRIYSMWVRPYRTADNRIDGLVLALVDITERKQSAEARYRRLFESSVDGIVIATAATGEIVDVNPCVIRLFRYPRTLLIGARFWESDLFAGSGLGKSLSDLLRDSESIQKNVALRTEEGDLIYTEVVCNHYVEGERRVIQFNIRDISSRKREEDRLRREDELFRQSQKMDAVGRLAGGVAHDFNNLLTGILGYCDLLEPELDGDGIQAHELVKEIRFASERAAVLTRQLLAFGRKQVSQLSLVDLNDAIREMRQLITVSVGAEIQLVMDLANDPGLVRADRGQLEQVILNLVLNARDAMPKGGKLTITTADTDVDETFSQEHPAVPAGRYVMFSVKDTGSGMDAETQSHLFEPFFSTKAKGKGTGLGLSTAHGIVAQNGGYIWANSELGAGSTFTVYLPRVDSAAEEPQSDAEPVPKKTGGTETILLVDDEPSIRRVARRFLEQQGYKVLEAPGGPEALRIAKEHQGPIHLLLTDVVMPDLSGREIAVKVTPERPDMKVLYMSGHTDDMILHHGVLNDQGAFLQKPFNRDNLSAKVRQVLDREA